jgi:hypothetical protein
VDNTFLCTVATLQYWRLWRFGGSISSASWDLHPIDLDASRTHAKMASRRVYRSSSFGAGSQGGRAATQP